MFSHFLYDKILNLDNTKLKNYCLGMKEQHSGVVNSNYGGWQSDNIYEDDENIKALAKKINENIVELKKYMELKRNLI